MSEAIDIVAGRREVGAHDYLLELADMLDREARRGGLEDSPEGARYIRISDSLATEIAGNLRDIAGSELQPARAGAA